MTCTPGPDPLRRLRSEVREQAAPLREASLRVDRDPGLLPELVEHTLPWRTFTGLPPAYHSHPLRFDGVTTYLHRPDEQVVAWEELARADAGTTLGLPGPAMSGHLIAELGDESQKERYYRHLTAGPAWTFFGMTEPAHGSDPAGMTTKLTSAPDGALLLSGTKKYVGNGARAGLGVVFARRRPGPLGVVAVLIDTDRPGFTATALETLGLRGLQLSELHMRQVPLADEDLLGRHLSATRRGMWAAVRTFNRFRPLVAALALGVAQAAHEYVIEELRGTPRAARHYPSADFADRLAGVRAMVLTAARSIDQDPDDGTPSSTAKLHATRLAEDLTTVAARALGPGARWDHPLVDKWGRDARAFEFMEGTSNIQRLGIAQGYLQRGCSHERAAG